jgi:type I restriction enzyme S subunit
MTNTTAQLLEQHFDTAFSAPNGIKRLRELILTLAMQGKLVPQDPKDQPASELLKEITAQKERLVKEGKIKKQKPLPEIDEDEKPYPLPQGWEWVRLGTIGNIFNGNSINASEKESKYSGIEGFPYIATKDVGYGFEPLDYDNGICIPLDEEKFRIAHQGAVLICAEGGSAGKKCGLANRDIFFGNKLFANELYGDIPSKFILYIYLSPAFRNSFTSMMTGIIGGISIAKFVEIPISLPPLAEQQRIVAKIDELMAKCDALEVLQQAQSGQRTKTHQAAIQQLLTTDETSTAWRFLKMHFETLYQDKANVKELRKAILQLAVMGKLVPQDLGNMTAKHLVQQITDERNELIKAGEIKPFKKQFFEPSYPLFQIPENWVWCRIQDISLKVTDGEHSTPKRSESGYYLLSARNVTNEGIKLDDVDFVEEDEFIRIRKRCNPEIGDVLISCSGSVGRVSICDSNKYVMVRSAALIKQSKRYMNASFLSNTLKAPFSQSQIVQKSKTTAQSNLFLGKILEIEIPLPPLEEQNRIVAKIDQLMALCDQLEARIDERTGKQSELLAAVISEV